MSSVMALLQLGDGRFPAGGHVHSAGVESAVADGRITGQHSLEEYLVGRMTTVGLTDAALVAATVMRLDADADIDTGIDIATAAVATPQPDVPPVPSFAVLIAELDAEAEARIAAPPLRAASRKLGRQLCRVAARCWPDDRFDAVRQSHPEGLHQSVALGLVAAISGVCARDAATVAMHHALNTPGQAAVRLLGLDPFATVALTVALTERANVVIDSALAAASGPLADLPARTGPLCEIAAMDHPHWDMRLFAS